MGALPLKKDLWAYRGRVDDTILSKQGYMCNQISMEQHVSQHSEVRAVLMAGTGRSQPALIIERAGDQPLSSPAEQEVTEQIWPIIEEANRTYKMGTRVSKSHILYTNLLQPMRRVGKGTVQRSPTLELYEDALDALYAREGDILPGTELVLLSFNPKEQ